MDIQLTGTVEQILELKSGEGRNGPWRKRDFILNIPGQYPKQVCITQWGDNIDKNPISEGQQITASVDIQSREYNGNWYTDVKAWKIEQGAGGGQTSGPLPPSLEESQIDLDKVDDFDDELPF